MSERSAINLPFAERDINGTLYRANRLLFEEWAALTEDLADMLGEPAASLLRGDAMIPDADERGSMLEFMAVMLGSVDLPGVVRGLTSRLTARNMTALARHMAKGLMVDGKPLTYDRQKMHWAHHMRDLAPVVGLFLEAQYADFFAGFGGLLPPNGSPGSDLSGEVSGT
jgi:hypothetical protein